MKEFYVTHEDNYSQRYICREVWLGDVRRYNFTQPKIRIFNEDANRLAAICADRYGISYTIQDGLLSFESKYRTRVIRASWWYILFQRYETFYEVPLNLDELFARAFGLYNRLYNDPEFHYFLWHNVKYEQPIPHYARMFPRNHLGEVQRMYRRFCESRSPIFVRSDIRTSRFNFYLEVLDELNMMRRFDMDKVELLMDNQTIRLRVDDAVALVRRKLGGN